MKPTILGYLHNYLVTMTLARALTAPAAASLSGTRGAGVKALISPIRRCANCREAAFPGCIWVEHMKIRVDFYISLCWYG